MSSHVQMTSFVNACDVKIAEKRYACLKIANNKTKLNMTCVSSHRCLGSHVVKKKEFQLKGFINLSRQKQNYRFYLVFDKSWYCPVKLVIYSVMTTRKITLSVGTNNVMTTSVTTTQIFMEINTHFRR